MSGEPVLLSIEWTDGSIRAFTAEELKIDANCQCLMFREGAARHTVPLSNVMRFITSKVPAT